MTHLTLDAEPDSPRPIDWLLALAISLALWVIIAKAVAAAWIGQGT